MDQYNGTILHISYFKVTKSATINGIGYGKEFRLIETIHGTVTTEDLHICSRCGDKLHFHQYLQMTLHHLTISDRQINLLVAYKQYLCENCHKVSRQHIPFKEPGHRITTAFYRITSELLRVSGATVGGIAKALRTSWKLVKEVDKTDLKERYKDMKPTHYSPYLCVDEFSLHKGQGS